MTSWEIKILVFANDICGTNIVFHLQISTEGGVLHSFQFAARGPSPLNSLLHPCSLDNLTAYETNDFHHTCCVLWCFICRDDFQQWHFVNRRKVVHANDLLWPFACLGDLGYGQGRSVGCKDAMLWNYTLNFFQHFVFNTKVFKHCFNHHVYVLKIRVV